MPSLNMPTRAGLHATRLTSWREWQERCALGRCEPATRSDLRGFAAARFELYLEHYGRAPGAGPGRNAVDGRDAWHLLESHMTIPNAQHGKRYKDWLFARLGLSADAALDVIQGGATLIMRTVVRTYIRDELPEPDRVSLQAPLGGPGDEDGLSLEQLLPGDIDPREHAAHRELAAMARQRAEALFPSVAKRVRVAMAARRHRVALSHPQVTAFAGCAKSALHDTYRAFVAGLVRDVSAEFAHEDRSVVIDLAALTLEALADRASAWATDETPLGALMS